MRNALIAIMLVLSIATTAYARELAGVSLPETMHLPNGQDLILNGAGLRTKMFFKIYVGALYLPLRTNDADAAMAPLGPRRVFMRFVYDEIAAEKIQESWREGYEENLTKAELDALKPRIDRFCALFPTVKKGDTFTMDFAPGAGVTVSVNDRVKGAVEGDDFIRATLGIWLGKHPVDSDLKKGMLGKQ